MLTTTSYQKAGVRKSTCFFLESWQTDSGFYALSTASTQCLHLIFLIFSAVTALFFHQNELRISL